MTPDRVTELANELVKHLDPVINDPVKTEAAAQAAAKFFINQTGGWEQIVTFFLAILVMTLALLWGLRTIISVLNSKDPQGVSVLSRVLSEKNLPAKPAPPPSPAAAASPAPPAKADQSNKETPGSFSRVAGSFGALGLAVAIIGISYWVVYSLFYGKPLTGLETAGWYFLSGSSLFAPYAFNQLSGVFKIS